MVQLSNQIRAQLIGAISRAVQRSQTATDSVDAAAADVLGINRTDLRALSVLAEAGAPLSASQLAAAMRLTRGATTTALDRLERAGYVRREQNPEDGRGVRIALTAKIAAESAKIWGPIGEDSSRFLARFSVKELELILRFIEESTTLQEHHVERIASLRRRSGSKR
jgi:DNA-binding MarR family transcriptional regulator